MKELSVISGKGGTGKTTITAALATLAAPVVVADCDVDAPDLHLVLTPEVLRREAFSGRTMAVVDEGRCQGSGRCLEVCRFGALTWKNGNIRTGGGQPQALAIPQVDPLRCNGCGFCSWICPDQAISMDPVINGELLVSRTRTGPMVHARLGIAEDNSGKLVTRVRRYARELAESRGQSLVLIDGPPGIGCPVIAAMTGADLVLVITEPTVSGRHDLERVVDLARHFGLPFAVCVNKWDLNPSFTDAIEAEAAANGAVAAGRVRYDRVTTAAMVAQKTVIEYSTDGISEDVRALWGRLRPLLGTGGSSMVRQEVWV